MSFTVFSYNATVLLIQPNVTQPITCAGKCDLTQPNPWMDPTHVHLCTLRTFLHLWMKFPLPFVFFFDPCSLVTQYKSSGITSKFSGPFCLHAPSVENSSHTRNLKNHGRLHIGANGASWPPWKSGWKIKKRNMQNKSSFLNIWEQSGQAGVENSAVLTT